ncbi:chemotaxis protein CheD [Carboxylicivirga linearis]|uniref:Probable chemoreceptor glutamine deamidase CheD n=1 Tax=Carboxylicivirga linearis TaxID=1628157 RepID=A0ABS5JPJ1_9BACT|nr:chemotaxis protein CheD [Carboxylicivirga linearis]MBS2096823.1 chemotaxis protein CheD [Carboxylicivirga linearis]
MENRYLQHFLYPSSLYVSKEPYVIKTILGSCVAICIWDKKLKFGGMNHYMLPNWNGNELASPKYGNIAIDKLIERMFYYGSNRKDLVAKIFGGGELLEARTGNSMLIGERNIRVARLMLEERNIPIVASSTGGKRGRKILFFSDTGEVRHKFLEKKVY